MYVIEEEGLADAKIIHIHYDSVADFFENTDPNKSYPKMHSGNKGDQSEVKGRGDRTWRFGDDSSREGYYSTRFDPTKGKNICEEDVKSVIASKEYKSLLQQALTYKKRIKFVDVGFRLNVARAISGDDKYFASFTNARKPTVKLCINICGSACVDANDFKNVAKTAVPTIYALETAGIATEVYYCAFARETHPDDFKYQCP